MLNSWRGQCGYCAGPTQLQQALGAPQHGRLDCSSKGVCEAVWSCHAEGQSGGSLGEIGELARATAITYIAPASRGLDVRSVIFWLSDGSVDELLNGGRLARVQ